MIVITVPLLFPVLPSYGIDPILFGVVLVIFVELGQISPPIGINLFVIQSIWDGKLSEVVIGTIPFHLIMFVVLGLVIFWPELHSGCRRRCRDDRAGMAVTTRQSCVMWQWSTWTDGRRHRP